MKISIYQVNMKCDENNVAFMSYDLLPKFQGSQDINSSIYNKVFNGEVNCETLEDVFRKFNIDHPAGYTGRSLSVSDVVEITDGERKGFYFCDSVGFKKIDFDSSLCKNFADEKKISVLLIEPEKKPRTVEISATLEAMQELVGGYIEEYMPFEDEVR